jgi:hypothetical protein
MPDFKCDACGMSYTSRDNFSVCPYCMGLGRPDPNCICQKIQKAFGAGPLNVISKINLECPVHGSGRQT